MAPVDEVAGDQAVHTTAYHPIANGLVERFHRQLKTALKAQSNNTNWATTCLWYCWAFALPWPQVHHRGAGLWHHLAPAC